MLLNEMFDENPIGYSTEKDDQSVIKLNDLRKTKLTLSRIKKLRILNDIRKLELAKKKKRLKAQYAAPAEGGEGMGGLGI
jgi:hypothetical protein